MFDISVTIFPSKSTGLVFVSVWVPLLHHGVVEVLVGEEAGPEHHRQTDGQDGSHHAAVYDGVDTLPPPLLLLLPVLILVLRNGIRTPIPVKCLLPYRSTAVFGKFLDIEEDIE